MRGSAGHRNPAFAHPRTVLPKPPGRGIYGGWRGNRGRLANLLPGPGMADTGQAGRLVSLWGTWRMAGARAEAGRALRKGRAPRQPRRLGAGRGPVAGRPAGRARPGAPARPGADPPRPHRYQLRGGRPDGRVRPSRRPPGRQAAVRVYRNQPARYAGMRALEVWYSRVDASEIIALSNGRRRRAVNDHLARAQHHTNLDALPRLTEQAGDGRRFLEDPPLLTHAEECHPGWVEEIMARYRASLSDERRQLLSRFRHPGRRVVNRPGRPGPLRPAVRLGPGQDPCPQRRRRHHQWLPGHRGPLRPGRCRLRRGVRRPDRGRLCGVHAGPGFGSGGAG